MTSRRLNALGVTPVPMVSIYSYHIYRLYVYFYTPPHRGTRVEYQLSLILILATASEIPLHSAVNVGFWPTVLSVEPMVQYVVCLSVVRL